MSNEPHISEADDSRILTLMRHAKAEWPAGLPDRDRPLSPTGVLNARLASSWLGRHHQQPDLVWVSSSRRTRQTWAEISSSWASPIASDISDDLYETSAGLVIRQLNQVPNHIRHLMLVGHEPTMSHLCWALARMESNREAMSRIRQNFPTSAIAVLRGPAQWSAWEPETCSLVRFEVRRPGNSAT